MSSAGYRWAKAGLRPGTERWARQDGGRAGLDGNCKSNPQRPGRRLHPRTQHEKVGGAHGPEEARSGSWRGRPASVTERSMVAAPLGCVCPLTSRPAGSGGHGDWSQRSFSRSPFTPRQENTQRRGFTCELARGLTANGEDGNREGIPPERWFAMEDPETGGGAARRPPWPPTPVSGRGPPRQDCCHTVQRAASAWDRGAERPPDSRPQKPTPGSRGTAPPWPGTRSRVAGWPCSL